MRYLSRCNESRNRLHEHRASHGGAVAKVILGALLLLLHAGAIAATLSGKVVRVSDGDTVTILDGANRQHRIRLAGIDAPETRQPYGQASRKNLASLIAGKEVTVESQKADKYGRTVGVVWLDGKDICLEQVSAGMAWHYKQYAREQHATERQSYADTEQNARVLKVGLWQDRNPMAPWVYRKSPKH